MDSNIQDSQAPQVCGTEKAQPALPQLLEHVPSKARHRPWGLSKWKHSSWLTMMLGVQSPWLRLRNYRPLTLLLRNGANHRDGTEQGHLRSVQSGDLSAYGHVARSCHIGKKNSKKMILFGKKGAVMLSRTVTLCTHPVSFDYTAI